MSSQQHPLSCVRKASTRQEQLFQTLLILIPYQPCDVRQYTIYVHSLIGEKSNLVDLYIESIDAST